MTAKDVEGAMEIECALGEQRRAAERAKWFRAGAEAMRKAAADYLACRGDCAHRADDIRTLRLPESDNG